MSKAKIYRFIGYPLIVFGVIFFVLSVSVNISQFVNAQRHYRNYDKDFLSVLFNGSPYIFDILNKLALNIPLWLGILALWKAERSEKPKEKSVVLKIIKPFAIFTLIIIWISALAFILSIVTKFSQGG